jgi:hypothetical protein
MEQAEVHVTFMLLERLAISSRYSAKGVCMRPSGSL